MLYVCDYHWCYFGITHSFSISKPFELFIVCSNRKSAILLVFAQKNSSIYDIIFSELDIDLVRNHDAFVFLFTK